MVESILASLHNEVTIHKKLLNAFYKYLFLNFKHVPEPLQKGKQNERRRYQPEVSDVSDCEMVEAVNSAEKVMEGHVAKKFPIFKPLLAQKAVRSKIIENKPGIMALNPPHTELEMIDLGKKRWVYV